MMSDYMKINIEVKCLECFDTAEIVEAIRDAVANSDNCIEKDITIEREVYRR